MKMHRKTILSSIVILLFLLITSCQVLSSYMDDGITNELDNPSINRIAISGTWKRIKETPLNPESKVEKDDLNELYINSDYVQIADRLTDQPKFKTRYLYFADYVRYRLADISNVPEDLEREGTLYSISDGQFFYQDIYYLSEDELALIYNGKLNYYQKLSNNVDEKVISEGRQKALSIRESLESENIIDTNYTDDIGVLLGLKRPSYDPNANLYYDYATYFVRISEDTAEAYAIKNLFLPRDTGFWSVGIEHLIDSDLTRDVVFAYPLASDTRENNTYLIGNKNSNNITYLDKNYFSIESKNYDSFTKSYGVYEINEISENTRLDIGEIAGEEGRNIYQEETARQIEDASNGEDIAEAFDSKNIGLRRVNGRWDFKSNIIKRVDNQLVMSDYSVNINPQIDILANNRLSVSWDQVRTLDNNAIDAYTSPDGSILLVQNQDEINIYKINQNIVESKPIISIEVEKTDRIIMAEWTSGNNVQTWADAVLQQNRINIETMISY